MAQSLGMSAINRRMSNGEGMSSDIAAIARRKSSRAKSNGENNVELAKLRALVAERRRAEAEKVEQAAKSEDPATKMQLTNATPGAIKGRRLRCKMCRRELAAREHILEHESGQGQRSFAPRRRDMTQHRLDTEKRRQDKQKEIEEKQKERQRIAAEAAEDIIEQAEEDAIESDSEEEGEQKVKEGSPMQEDVPSNASAPAPAPEVQQPQQASTLPPARNVGATGRSLASRLPPQLAALRVSMPKGPAFTPPVNDESAIDDDDDNPPASAHPSSPPLLPSTICTSYFVEPLSWMQPQLENGQVTGKIICPNERCKSKLGNFDWAGCESY